MDTKIALLIVCCGAAVAMAGSGRLVHRSIILSILCIEKCFLKLNVSAGKRELLNTDDDISEAVNSIETEFRRFWGAPCLVDEACLQPVAFCSKTEGITTHRASLKV